MQELRGCPLKNAPTSCVASRVASRSEVLRDACCASRSAQTRQKLVTLEERNCVRHTVATVSVLVSLRRKEEPSARAGLPLSKAPETRFSFLGVSTRRRARASRGRSLGRRSLRIHRRLGWHLLGLPLAPAGRYTGATARLPLSCGCGCT